MPETRTVVFSARVESLLTDMAEVHNRTVFIGGKTSASMLKAVYRRGANTFSSSSNFVGTRHDLAVARVEAFLHLLRVGEPANPMYRQDFDLLPVSHPKSTRSVTAGAVDDYLSELQVGLFAEGECKSPEKNILNFVEFFGLGYEAEPAIRAAWLRGVSAGESPYHRALNVAQYTSDSSDADLLPKP